MVMKAINLARTYDYVSDTDEDKGTDKECKFQFKMLTGAQVAYLNDMLMDFVQSTGGAPNTTKMNMGRAAYKAVQMACTGAVNFVDEQGLPVQIKHESQNINGVATLVVTDDVMNQIPSVELNAMYQLISRMNGMSKDQAKKSVAA